MSKYANMDKAVYNGTTCGGFRGCKGRTYDDTDTDCQECAQDAQRCMAQAMSLTIDKKDKRAGIKFEALPDYGDHMTVTDFLKGCYSLMLTDTDGIACYATKDQITSIQVRPSDFVCVVDHPYTHVVWFNK